MPNLPDSVWDTLKIVVLGESGIGKTSFTDKVVHDAQYVRYDPTYLFGKHGNQMAMNVDGDVHYIRLDDVSLTPIRSPEHGALSEQYATFIRDADGVVLLYDITDSNSYDAITETGWEYVWSRQAKSWGRGWDFPNGHKKFGCVLVGNKVDLLQGEGSVKRQVSKDLAEEWASMMGVEHFEVDRFNREALEDVVRALVRSVQWAKRRNLEDIRMTKIKSGATTAVVQGSIHDQQIQKSKQFLGLTRLKERLTFRTKSKPKPYGPYE
ncbi:P-loop containing nucleoside triphosphate hydrolase protein [Bimuria novae-zelandiae CBS 107.79]|uniref:P-loop containing nucleoside triphosphate hydrolase protein n=1 Tax=Bimuria novae-zelandiae CBS 107.79 TaxID=1447943 RepID=A0A6A5V7S5_9PLEO|nr:P-loop containing nucleoside triphosphate hydrolase protein [Bimuria novae-zelandiae CBS 107.79]